ncbi:HEAT repeat domain-containing protein [Microbispora hainanensis]|uniref:HEAT repeat domain-containing protein n=1 Tax=Microbispora hainanensis TaxID=568844 RepID=A0ABZ1T120_9ACTN|nr:MULTISPECIES: HEAT repeat domain-containing protein [Microbispora]NJP23136.1 HEAT repeat domain-containing protein [Microbispora sp. CL1-1]
MVREQCCRLLDHLLVEEALDELTAMLDDPSSAVRKKAGWYAPGGPIHRRTAPRPVRGS